MLESDGRSAAGFVVLSEARENADGVGAGEGDVDSENWRVN